MKTKFELTLKPETTWLLKIALPLFAALYAISVFLYSAAGALFDYQLALVLTEQLVAGLRASFGLLFLGVLLMECR